MTVDKVTDNGLLNSKTQPASPGTWTAPSRGMRNLLLFLMFSLSLSNDLAVAREGFSTNGKPLPEPVKEWSKRVYMVFDENGKQPVGTAFLVHHDRENLHFITARHVVSACPRVALCSLRAGRPWMESDLGKPFHSPVHLQPAAIGIYRPQSSAWQESGAASDLAYIRVQIKSAKPSVDIRDIGRSLLNRFPKDEYVKLPHFIIGYPFLSSRPSFARKPGADIVTLRWSFGEKITKRLQGKRFVLHSDADSLTGNSGGPVILPDGTLIGVLFGGPPSQEYAPDYSHLVPIDYVKLLVTELLRNGPGILWLPVN